MNDYFNQLLSYVREHMQQGVPEQELYQSLQTAGWPSDWMNAAFLQVRSELEQAVQQAKYVEPAVPIQYQQLPPVVQPPTYKVFRALGDGIRAIRFNMLAYGITLLAGTGLAIILGFIGGYTLYGLLVLFGASGWLTGIALGLVMSLMVASFVKACSALTIFASTHELKADPGDIMFSAVKRLPRFFATKLSAS